MVARFYSGALGGIMDNSNKSSAIFQPEWMRDDVGCSWLAFLRIRKQRLHHFIFRGSVSIQLTPQYPRDKRIYYIAIIFDIVEKNNSWKTSFFHTRFPITVIYIYFCGCYGISLSPSWATQRIAKGTHSRFASTSAYTSSNDWDGRRGGTTGYEAGAGILALKLY